MNTHLGSYTRIELIDPNGRVYVRYVHEGDDGCVGISEQDDGNTLKIFVGLGMFPQASHPKVPSP